MNFKEIKFYHNSITLHYSPSTNQQKTSRLFKQINLLKIYLDFLKPFLKNSSSSNLIQSMDQPQKEGFSSEQELNEDTFRQNEPNFLDQIETQNIRINALHSVQPAQEIKKKQYSLQPDMLTGWKPKIYLPKPIPLIFYNDELDYAIETLIKMRTFKQQTSQSNQNFIQLVYLGPRYESTYSAWFQKPFQFPYTHLNKNKRLKFTDREFVGQYLNAETQNHLHFDSFFQSGNLDVVFKIGQLQYDLFMRVDSNTRGHLQWYNFKVKNMKKDHVYTFNICNFSKEKSLYSRGMKPFAYSKKLYESKNKSWSQTGSHVKYEKKTPKSFKICQLEIDEKPYRLSFTYESFFENDQVQFAYCIPYEYSRLKSYLEGLEKKYGDKNFLKVSRLTHTLGGLDIPIITITSNLNEKTERQFVNKKLVLASGRIHPGQSNGSFMMQGLINFLCNDTQQCQQLRDSVVFKIVSMVNPDGVVLGNYRTSLSGKDLNRQFINPDEYIFPEIYHLKKYIWKLKNLYKQDFLMYLDLHGHSTKKNCFTYGPEFSITNNSYYQCRIFPKLLSMQTEMFRYFSCVFKISQCKERTLRAVLLKYFDVDAVFTVEVSNGSYYSHQLLEDVLFDAQKWIQMGQKLGKSISQYANIFKELTKIKQRKKQERLRIKREKQKFKVRQPFIKRQNGFSNRQRYSLSATKARINQKVVPQPSSISKFSPIKKKALGYSNSQFSMSQKRLEITSNAQGHDDENMFQLYELKDEKLCMFLKQIYKKPTKNKFGAQQLSNSPQRQQQKSHRSDDNISEGGSDSSSSSQDLNEGFKKQLFKNIKNGSEKFNSLNALTKKKPHTLTQINVTLKTSQDQSTLMQNQTDLFYTDLCESSNELQDFKKESKINSLKMNQLRSRRYIYLKRKSYQMNIIPSTKRQTKNTQTAKIVNFQFVLNPIKPTSHIWHEKQQASNTIHSLFMQASKQKFEQKATNIVSFAQYMDMDLNTKTQRAQQSQQYLQQFKKRVFSVPKNTSSSAHHMQANKQANIALLRKTQQRKLNINPAFYRNVKPKKQRYIQQQNNIIGQRIQSPNKKQRCLTQPNQS